MPVTLLYRLFILLLGVTIALAQVVIPDTIESFHTVSTHLSFDVHHKDVPKVVQYFQTQTTGSAPPTALASTDTIDPLALPTAKHQDLEHCFADSASLLVVNKHKTQHSALTKLTISYPPDKPNMARITYITGYGAYDLREGYIITTSVTTKSNILGTKKTTVHYDYTPFRSGSNQWSSFFNSLLDPLSAPLNQLPNPTHHETIAR
jgi:hypothetical protein